MLTMPRPTRATSTASANRAPLTREEEVDLAARAGTDPAARARLVASLRGYVVQIARRYQCTEIALDELVAAGEEGVVSAIAQFDPSQGRLITYAGHWIRMKIRNYAFEARNVVGCAWLIQHAKMVRAYEATILETEGNDSAACDAARAAWKDPIGDDRIRDIVRRMGASRSRSLNEPWHQDDGESGGATWQDMLTGGFQRPDEATESSHDGERLANRVRNALSMLTARSREIIERCYLGESTETLEAIGNDLGLTRERVRQLESQAIAKLRMSLAGDYAKTG